MKMRQRIADAFPALIYLMRISAIGAIVVWLASSVSSLAVAQQAAGQRCLLPESRHQRPNLFQLP